MHHNDIEAVFAELRSRYRYIVVDTPPVLAVPDARVVSHVVDGTLVVADAGITRIRQLKRTISLLERADAKLLGTVLNRSNVGGATSYYGYYRVGEE